MIGAAVPEVAIETVLAAQGIGSRADEGRHMTEKETDRPSSRAEPAPEFTLPAASGEGFVSLAQYRGKSPVYLALFRGLYCSFCRRHVVHLGSTAEKLREMGVQTLGVVATEPERARFYFRFRPSRMPMGADPELATHQAYGLPNIPITREAVDRRPAAAARELRRLNREVAAESARCPEDSSTGTR